MFLLIKSEWKKIFKNKINVILVIGLIFYNVWFFWNSFQSYPNEANQLYFNAEEEWEYLQNDGSIKWNLPSYEERLRIKDIYALKTFDGKPFQSAQEFYDYAHSIYEQYRGGNIKEQWEKFAKDYETYFKEFTSEIDEALTEAVFQENHEEKMKLYEQRLNVDELPYYDMVTDLVHYPIYKQQGELFTLSLIYGNQGYLQQNTLLEGGENQDVSKLPLYALSHFDTREKMQTIWTEEGKEPSLLETYAKEQIHLKNAKFGSAIAPIRYLKGEATFTIFNLIVCIILFANSYAREKQRNMEQIIVPVSTKFKTILKSKWLANIILGIGIECFITFLCFGITCFFSGMEGWDMPLMNQAGEVQTIYQTFLTFKTYAISRFLLRILAVFVVVTLTTFVSYFTKNQFYTLLIMLAFLLLPIAFERNLPDIVKMMAPSYLFMGNEVYLSIGNYENQFPVIFEFMQFKIWWKDFATVLWIFICLGLVKIMDIHANKHEVV